MSKKRKAGRPRKAAADKRGEFVGVKMTTSELAVIDEKRQAMPRGAYLRQKALAS